MRRLAIGCALALLVAACPGGTASRPSSSGPSLSKGGTLRIAMVSWDDPTAHSWPELDPALAYDNPSWELLRCCLLRTLLSYRGRPTSEGGAQVFPDLASGTPTVSDDGLTWTFQVKPGIHYGPPLENVKITSEDFVRALKREARGGPMGEGGGYSFYYSVIKGFDAYQAGNATSISGLETPDQRTLVVRLTRPTGDLGYRFAMPATAPIPPSPRDQEAPFGIYSGHSSADGFLVSTGPYMLSGSGALDLDLPPRWQRPVTGYVKVAHETDGFRLNGHVTLLRNPSWKATTDALRPAYPDRIEIDAPDLDHLREPMALLRRWAKQTADGSLDMIFSTFLSLPDQVRSFRADPELGAIHVDPQDFQYYLTMNLAVPPFEDIHVRRAMNLVIDKARLLRSFGDPLGLGTARVATHIALDSQENDLLLGFDPYRTPHEAGDLAAAQAEMALSRYDRNHDGRCDDSVCASVSAVTHVNAFLARKPALVNAVLRNELAGIGIHLHVEGSFPDDGFYGAIGDPTTRTALGIGAVWGTDYPNGSNYLAQLFSFDPRYAAHVGTVTADYSLVGASPRQLRGWGYSDTTVPSVDPRIQRCVPLVGLEQARCWAYLDQYLMTQVVPWVPLWSGYTVRMIPSNVVSYSFDQFARMPALDRIALEPERR